MTTGDRPQTPDGRRGGPVPVGSPNDEDRGQVAKLQEDAANRRRQEAEAIAAAAEPAGVPPSDEQRQAIDALRARSAELRGPAARAIRRNPVAVGVVYDDERKAVEDLQNDARNRRLDELEQRGIVDPTIEQRTAGFPAELPHLPGHELYGIFTCPNCGAGVERAFPGYVDWDLASRDLVCPQCGGVVLRGGAGGQSEPPPQAETAEQAPTVVDDQASGQIQPPGVQTSAQPVTGDVATSVTAGQPPAQPTEALETGPAGTTSGPGAQPLTADERAELEQLRAERAQREAERQTPPAALEQPPPESPAPA